MHLKQQERPAADHKEKKLQLHQNEVVVFIYYQCFIIYAFAFNRSSLNVFVKVKVYLGEWLVGGVRGLLRLLGGRGGVRPHEFTGDGCRLKQKLLSELWVRFQRLVWLRPSTHQFEPDDEV